VALIGLLASTAACAAIIYYTVEGMDTMKSLLYATPLSILSSAIIIPSVGNLDKQKKEFHIYESTFSDILGIMLFYFIEGMMENASGGGAAFAQFSISLVGTIVISLIASYLLIYMFQNIGSHVKLFFLIAILILLYALGKKLHLSSLIIILIFGLVMSNHHLFFKGKLKKWLKEDAVKQIEENFHVVTVETAFLVRTFFFVIFGITISLASLWDLRVLQISAMILASIYVVRYIIFRLLTRESILPQLFIAPRGLITVLLFFSIPDAFQVPAFDQGILLFVIIATSLVMAFTLIREKNRQAKRNAATQDDPLVIPPDQIYKGFQSRILDQYREK
jgi:NhaP-type Na+/H+ or K+/H+ antiporter